MDSYTKITSCRICGNTDLVSVLNLGHQALTGVFPKSLAQSVTEGPLELVKCNDEKNPDACGLLQLAHSYNHSEMYGDNYGYRSGLNSSMVEHLQFKAGKLTEMADLKPNDIVLDIGSNDATSLKAYPEFTQRIGIDPTAAKFKSFYTDGIKLVPDFFNAAAFMGIFGTQKAKVVSSIAMFYDLESPLDFMNDIYKILDDEGLWVFEQSYMPGMLDALAYDTVCHEHLEYYALKQIQWMSRRCGLKIIDVTLNNTNGGSFEIICAKQNSSHSPRIENIKAIEQLELRLELNTINGYKNFENKVHEHRKLLIDKLESLRKAGKKVLGYGASTKGNVLLQYCNFTTKEIPCIAEVNPEKFGSFTPKTLIPIVSEADAKKQQPDYFLVLPWHFRDNIIKRESEFIKSGGKLLFPLPYIHEAGISDLP